MINKKSQLGIVLTEALISVSMLLVAMLILSSIITNAISTTKISKNFLIAQNLATEGLESVKNVRDTNWLVHTNHKCWLVISDECDGNQTNLTKENNYISYLTNGKWIIKEVSGSNDLDLKEATDHSSMSDYVLYLKENFYTAANVTGSESPFYRSIKIIDSNEIKLIYQVRIQWHDGSRIFTIDRNRILYNYL